MPGAMHRLRGKLRCSPVVAWRSLAVFAGPAVRLLATAMLCLGCGVTVAAPAPRPAGRTPGTSTLAAADASSAVPAAAVAIDYTFALDDALATLEAEACFRGAPPAQLMSGMPAAASALRSAVALEPAGRRPLQLIDHRIVLQGVAPDSCIAYTIGLDAADDMHGFAVERRGRALATNVAVWLWRPPAAITASSSTARLRLPSAVRASLPWPREGDRYRLDASAFAFYAYAAFGAFEIESVDVPGASIEVAILEGLSRGARDAVVPWVQHAARLGAQPFGRFPRSRAQLVVLPADARGGWGGEDDPVPFGTVTRGGGASALMLLARDARREALMRDWVAVHEFSHLLHPFLARSDAWLSEGIATYYQEVLRVRAGVHAEGDAWRRLHEGASLGRETTQPLAEQSAAMMQTHAFRRIYWAGAAFALLTDAEVRRQSGGRVTLDALLRDLAPRVEAQVQPWQARELLSALDAMLPAPVFLPAMQRWVQGAEMPDLSELYGRFGIQVRGAEVTFQDEAEEAWIRRAIMRP